MCMDVCTEVRMPSTHLRYAYQVRIPSKKNAANRRKTDQGGRETMPHRTRASSSTDIFSAVKENLDLCTVIQAYTGQELRRAGRNLTGLCPLHSENTPSFTVQPERNFFHCFGCGAHGSVIDFTMQYFSLSALDAARKLAEDFGIPVPDTRRMSPEESGRIQEQAAQRKRQRTRKKALATWTAHAYIEVCALRRMCWQSLHTAQDFYDHPEFVHTLEYCDHVLDILAYGTDAEKASVLEAKLQGRLGLVGGFMP